MKPATRRIIAAIAEHLADADFEHVAGGMVTVAVRVDDAGCPKRISVKTEVERPVDAQARR